MKKIIWIITFLPLIITSAVIQFMPDRVPMHYDMAGNIDRYGSKFESFIFPVIIILMTAFLMRMVSGFTKKAETSDTDKERAEARSNANVMEKITLALTAMEGVIQCSILFKAAAQSHAGLSFLDIDAMKLSCLLCGIIFIVGGNYLPKTKRNGLLGLRVSWTAYNDTTWNKSNRYAAICLMLAGVCTIITCAFTGGLAAILLMTLYLTVALAAMLAYAHKIYLEEKSKDA